MEAHSKFFKQEIRNSARIPPQTPPAGGKSAEAGRILSDSGFLGGNTFVSALRADPDSASKCDFDFWRRERDSNPRDDFPPTRFPGVPVQPLLHPSETRSIIT